MPCKWGGQTEKIPQINKLLKNSRSGNHLYTCLSDAVLCELVHPLVFDRVYQFIFQLYGLSQVEQESKYVNKLEVLNKKSDRALMSFYEVETKFLPNFDTDDNQARIGYAFKLLYFN